MGSTRCAGFAELAPAALGSNPGRVNGGGGIRTHKGLLPPVFKTGALPFCHPSRR